MSLKKDFLEWLQTLNIDCVSDCETLPNEFSPLFQSQKLKPLWVYLMQHIKNEETALKMKKNIDLQCLRSENKTMRQSCNSLADELAELNLGVHRLKEKVDQKRAKCAKISSSMSKSQQNITCNYIKSLFHEQCTGTIKQRQKVVDAQNAALMSATALQHLNHSTINEDQHFYCCRDELKRVLISIRSHFSQGHESNRNHTHATDSWQATLSILKQYHPKMIIDALSSITQSDVEEVG